MTTRTLNAAHSGPVTIDAALLGSGGSITVRASATCQHAQLAISTDETTGPTADAVRDATLIQDGPVLTVRVEAGSGATVITGGGHNVIQASGNYGSTIQIGGNVVGGSMVNGVRNSDQNVKITATVPEGSTVRARTQAADIRIEGAVQNVTANTHSGDVTTTRHVDKVTASTQSGRLSLGRTDVVDGNTMSGDIEIRDFRGTASLSTMSGDIRVHATAGGGINARTMSGDIQVTATREALEDGLDVQPRTMSGRVSAPR